MSGRNKIYKENIIVKIFRITLLVILLPVVLVYLVANTIKKAKIRRENKEKIKIYSLSQIDSLTGVEFEKYLKILFEKMGYAVELTKRSKDFGADLIISKKDEIIAVQAKCYSKTVGVKAVQEIIGAKNHYKTKDAMVVTNNFFSKEAVVLAVENNIKLLDRNALENLSSKFEVFFEREERNYSALTKGAVQEIESKYKYWI